MTIKVNVLRHIDIPDSYTVVIGDNVYQMDSNANRLNGMCMFITSLSKPVPGYSIFIDRIKQACDSGSSDYIVRANCVPQGIMQQVVKLLQERNSES